MRKYLKDQSGSSQTITMMDLRKNPGEILTAVETGKTFIVTRAGKQIAILSKIPGMEMVMHVDSKGEITYKPAVQVKV